MNHILEEDIGNFSLPEDLRNKLCNSSIVVTGSTGFIGSCMVKYLLGLKMGIKFILPVRDRKKALGLLESLNGDIEIIETDIVEFFEYLDSNVDFIIHCASPTNGHFMVTHPSETFLISIESTKAILNYIKRRPVRGAVYLSSIEYYGQIHDDMPVSENKMGEIDHFSPRSSYSLGKQASEFLCFSYAHEFDIPVKIARLTQVFGAGIDKNDNRVFAQFARSILSGSDIVLHTQGKSSKPYCYISDCISAILYILLIGAKGEAYNVATPGTFISIRNLAELYRENHNPQINVVTHIDETAGYAPETIVNLDSTKLQNLGWKPMYNLTDMVSRLINYLMLEIK